MPETKQHRSPDTIWLFDYNSLLAMDDCPKYVVSLSERDINIIWQSVLNISRFRSRVFTAVNGTNYTIADIDQFSQFQEWVSDMNVNMGDFMTCTTALDLIAEALQALVDKPCCPSGSTSGSRGSGTTGEPPNPYNQDETPTDPPAGFSDMTQYNSHKCQAAQDLINNLRADLLGLSGIVYSGATPTGLVGTLIVFLLTPIPFDDLIALAAYLIYSAYSYTFLAEMSAQMSEENENLLCVLYSAAGASEAETAFLAALEDIALDYFSTTEDADWVMGAVEYMLSYDAFNVLFENVPTVSTEADCSECNNFPSFCRFMEEAGEGEIISDTVLETNAYEVSAGTYVWAVGWTGPEEITFSLEGGSLTTHASWPDGLQTIEDTANNCGVGNNESWNEEYSTFAVPVVTGPDKTVQFFSSTPFRIRAEITG